MRQTGDMGLIPGSGRSPGGGNGNHTPVFLPGKSQTEEPGGLQSMGSQTEQLSTQVFLHMDKRSSFLITFPPLVFPPLNCIFTFIYSWPLNKVGVWGTNPPHSKKSVFNLQPSIFVFTPHPHFYDCGFNQLQTMQYYSIYCWEKKKKSMNKWIQGVQMVVFKKHLYNLFMVFHCLKSFRWLAKTWRIMFQFFKLAKSLSRPTPASGLTSITPSYKLPLPISWLMSDI